MDAARISAHPIFRQLAFERGCLGYSLAALLSVAYFSYILMVAFSPATLGTPIRDGAVLTWGIVVGVGLLAFGFLLTATYVLVANTRLDTLSRRLREDV